MTKQEIAILEKVYDAEISDALAPLTGKPGITHLWQSHSKLAKKLANEGYLRLAETNYRGVIIQGYELTTLGSLAYCTSCQ